MKTNSDIITDHRMGFLVAMTEFVSLSKNDPLLLCRAGILVKTAMAATIFKP